MKRWMPWATDRRRLIVEWNWSALVDVSEVGHHIVLRPVGETSLAQPSEIARDVAVAGLERRVGSSALGSERVEPKVDNLGIGHSWSTAGAG